MRDILFRGKRKDNGEWVDGNYGFNDTFTEEKHYIFQNKAWEYSVVPDTVGQFIGLTDRNGKRIFEGDIIKISHKPKPYEVKYKRGCYYIGINWALSYEPDCEVIGNIIDNPELLEVDE